MTMATGEPQSRKSSEAFFCRPDLRLEKVTCSRPPSSMWRISMRCLPLLGLPIAVVVRLLSCFSSFLPLLHVPRQIDDASGVLPSSVGSDSVLGGDGRWQRRRRRRRFHRLPVLDEDAADSSRFWRGRVAADGDTTPTTRCRWSGGGAADAARRPGPRGRERGAADADAAGRPGPRVGRTRARRYGLRMRHGGKEDAASQCAARD